MKVDDFWDDANSIPVFLRKDDLINMIYGIDCTLLNEQVKKRLEYGGLIKWWTRCEYDIISKMTTHQLLELYNEIKTQPQLQLVVINTSCALDQILSEFNWLQERKRLLISSPQTVEILDRIKNATKRIDELTKKKEIVYLTNSVVIWKWTIANKAFSQTILESESDDFYEDWWWMIYNSGFNEDMKKWVMHHFQDLINDYNFEDDRLLNEYIMYTLKMIYPDMIMSVNSYTPGLWIDFAFDIVSKKNTRF
jgi:hypothetical protein